MFLTEKKGFTHSAEEFEREQLLYLNNILLFKDVILERI